MKATSKLPVLRNGLAKRTPMAGRSMVRQASAPPTPGSQRPQWRALKCEPNHHDLAVQVVRSASTAAVNPFKATDQVCIAA
jgi:hypothetical protein